VRRIANFVEHHWRHQPLNLYRGQLPGRTGRRVASDDGARHRAHAYHIPCSISSSLIGHLAWGPISTGGFAFPRSTPETKGFPVFSSCQRPPCSSAAIRVHEWGHVFGSLEEFFAAPFHWRSSRTAGWPVACSPCGARPSYACSMIERPKSVRHGHAIPSSRSRRLSRGTKEL